MKANRSGLWAALVTLSCIGCGKTSDDVATQQSSLISDGNHNDGVDGFYFLPPLVAPSGFSGAFEPGLSPVIEIRDLTDDAVIARFEGDAIEVDAVDGKYAVNWDTESSSLDVNRLYRIAILVEGQILGYADVDPVANGRELKAAATGETIPLLDGRTLPIKFRIETGVVVPVSLQLQPFANGKTAGSGFATLTVPSGTSAGVEFECLMNGVAIECLPPLSWTDLPDGSALILEVTAIPESGIRTSAVASAIVDALAPSVTDIVATDGIETDLIGPDVHVSFNSSDTSADGTVFVCTIDDNTLEPCEPGVPAFAFGLAHGVHEVNIRAVDSVGNESFFSLPFNVDARGPSTTLASAPASATCPDSTSVEEIRFYAVDPIPPSFPVHFICDLDGAPATCNPASSSTGVGGVFAFNDLADGPHTLTVTAVDRMGNLGPPVEVPFVVDRTPPNVNAVIAEGTVAVTLSDAGGHGPPTLTGCEVLSAVGSVVSDCLATCQNIDASEWTCSIAGAVGGVTLQLVAADTCGPVNTATFTTPLH